MKVRGGPMQGGFSTNEKAVDTFIITSHIVAQLHVKLNERLQILTNSSHKEKTKGAKRNHETDI